jgi:hypothetical protein
MRLPIFGLEMSGEENSSQSSSSKKDQNYQGVNNVPFQNRVHRHIQDVLLNEYERTNAAEVFIQAYNFV